MIKKLLASLAMLCALARAQVPVVPIVQPHVTFVNEIGTGCAGCSLYTYVAGTTTAQATYTDATGTSQNTNPIILDASGSANIWLGANSYKFTLKDTLGSTIFTVDQVNSARLFPCSTAGAVQIANSATNALTCDATITINTTTHTINVGTLPANYVTIAALGTPTRWTFDTTTPATALASLGGGSTGSGTANQLSYYSVTGSATSGTSAIPGTITATTRSPGDNSTFPATTAYVALPGAISPTSVQVNGGTAVTDNQGNGTKLQHSTGTTTTNDCAKFDANNNIVDAGFGCAPTGSSYNTSTGHSLGTTYQNTTAKPIFVLVTCNLFLSVGHTAYCQGRAGSFSPTDTMATASIDNSSGANSLGFFVPPSYFYGVYTSLGLPGETDPAGLYSWVEF